MIRPRAATSVATTTNSASCSTTSHSPSNWGANGVVFGILDITGSVDVARTRQLTDLARPPAVTFHCAFDMSGYLFRALEDLCAAGVDRVLTSRGEPTSLEGQKTIAQLVQKATSPLMSKGNKP
jgi:copper homeostasis protein